MAASTAPAHDYNRSPFLLTRIILIAVKILLKACVNPPRKGAFLAPLQVSVAGAACWQQLIVCKHVMLDKLVVL
jgi:hypothetical protein